MAITMRPLFGLNANSSVSQKPAEDKSITAPQSKSPFSSQHARTLKGQVMFGYSTHPKLTYQLEKTINDPALGQIEVYRFSNGQELYAVKKTDVPLTSFGILIKTGAYNEKAQNNGVSHFLEHLIFKGTPNLAPGESDRLLENLGAGVNAHTSWDQTFYFLYNIPKENLKESIRIQSELVQNAWIPQKELDRERGAVIEEIQMYADNKINSTLLKTLYQIQGDNPYRRPVLGPKKVIRTISRDEILEYYNRFYAPENRAVLVVGDFDTKEMLDTVASQLNKPFEAVKASSNRKKLKRPSTETDVQIQEPLNIAFATLGFQGPDPSTPEGGRDAVALNLINTILGEGKSSRLNLDLFEEKGLASMNGGFFHPVQHGSSFMLYAQTQPDQLSEVQKILEDHVRDIVEKPIDAAELEKAKNMLRRSLAQNLETQFGQIMALEKAVIKGFDAELGKRLEIIDALTPLDLQHAAKQYLSGTAYRVAMVPKEPPKKAKTKPDKVSAPRFTGSLDHQREKSIRLSKGTELIVQERPSDLFTSISVLAKGGNRTDTVTGETNLLAQLVQRGTKSRPMADFQREMEAHGISLEVGIKLADEIAMTLKEVSAQADGMVLTMKGLSTQKAKMYELLEDILINGPAVTDEDVAKIKDRLTQEHQRTQATEPAALASQMLYETLYPNDHPYGITTPRILERFEQLTPNLLKQSFHRLFHPDNITLAAAGDVSANELTGKTDTLIQRLPAASMLSLRDAKPPRLEQSKVVTRSKENLQQTQIVRGWHTPSLTDQDHATLKVLTTILSGGLTSRFFQTFPEKPEKALAYRVKANYDPKHEGGTMMFSIGTDHENVHRVLELLEQEVELLANEPPSDEEMNRAKLRLKTQAIADSQKTDAESIYLAHHRGFRTDSRIDALPKLEAVTAKDVQAVAQKVLKQPSVLSVVAPKTVLEANGFPVDGEGTV